MLNENVLLQVKNSLRAVNDRFEDSDDVPPPVRVIVAEGDEDVTIKVIPSGILKHTSSQPSMAQLALSLFAHFYYIGALRLAGILLCLSSLHMLNLSARHHALKIFSRVKRYSRWFLKVGFGC